MWIIIKFKPNQFDILKQEFKTISKSVAKQVSINGYRVYKTNACCV